MTLLISNQLCFYSVWKKIDKEKVASDYVYHGCLHCFMVNKSLSVFIIFIKNLLLCCLTSFSSSCENRLKQRSGRGNHEQT